MSELEDRINSVLNDPEQLARISALAQSIMGGAQQPEAEAAGSGVQAAESALGALPGLNPELLGKAAELLGGGKAAELLGGGNAASLENTAALGKAAELLDGGNAASLEKTAKAIPGLDLAALGKLLRGGGAKSRHLAALEALAPCLDEKRRDKLTRAIKLARLASLAKLGLGGTEGGHV